MFSFNRRHLLALLAWEVTVIGVVFILLIAMRPSHTLHRGNLLFLAYVAVGGIFVTAAIAFFSRRLGRIGAAVTGILCGLIPSIILTSWLLIARPGFEESAGTAAVAMMLAVPSAVGGAIAGLVCSSRTKNA